MSRKLPLEEKLRNSGVFTEEDIYIDFMDYAKEVRDELDLYLYMEENEIGIDQVDYWLARFKVMRSRCQLISLVQLLQKVKNLPSIQNEWRRVEAYEQKLLNDFKSIIYTTINGKRKASSFSKLRDQMHPEVRKIGNIEVYVQQRHRKNYQLQDFAKYIEQELKTFCSIQREDYLRQQSRKPSSFLAKKQEEIMELADQILSKNHRKSFLERKSIGNKRFSTNFNITKQVVKDQDYQTPKIIQQNPQRTPQANESNLRKQSAKSKGKSDCSRDSVEILRQMQEKQYYSPKFKCEGIPFKSDADLEKSVPVQKCRAVAHEQNQFFTFSFGKQGQPQFEFKDKEKKKVQNEEKDNAFIAYSFSQENFQDKTSSLVKPEDFELELLIYDIQREKYDKLDSQTFSSEIDSNQENKEVENQRFFSSKNSRESRIPFENINESLYEPTIESSNLKLEQLIEFDDDDKNPQFITSNQKNRCLEGNHLLNSFSIFRSEQKRLSNVTEQSSFFSESKNKKYSSKRV